MDQDKIKNLANVFCEYHGIAHNEAVTLKNGDDILTLRLILEKFLQSIIDNRQLLSIENYDHAAEMYAAQFKTTPGKVISDEEVDKYCDLFSTKYSSATGLKKAIEWYRDQLNNKS